jgi:hypothetical protein
MEALPLGARFELSLKTRFLDEILGLLSKVKAETGFFQVRVRLKNPVSWRKLGLIE